MQNLTPFGIAAEQCGSFGVQVRPAGQILVSELKQLRLLPQARGGATAQFKTDFVNQLVTHADSLVWWVVEVNDASETMKWRACWVLNESPEAG